MFLFLISNVGLEFVYLYFYFHSIFKIDTIDGRGTFRDYVTFITKLEAKFE